MGRESDIIDQNIRVTVQLTLWIQGRLRPDNREEAQMALDILESLVERASCRLEREFPEGQKPK